MFMLLLTLANCSLIIAALLIEDEGTLEIFEIIDKVFFAFYSLEVFLKVNFINLSLKILGLGFY